MTELRLPDICHYYTPELAAREEVSWVLEGPHQHYADWLIPRIITLGRGDGDPIENILEFGCGSGRLASILPRAIHYTGVDANPHFLRMANDRMKKDVATGAVRLLEMDIRTFNTFTSRDMGMMWDVLKHFSLDEADGWGFILGRLLAICDCAAFNVQMGNEPLDNGKEFHHTFVTEDMLRKVVEENGHEIVEMEPLHVFHVARLGDAKNVAVWTKVKDHH